MKKEHLLAFFQCKYYKEAHKYQLYFYVLTMIIQKTKLNTILFICNSSKEDEVLRHAVNKIYKGSES